MAPKFQDDPEKREARLKSAPRANDRYGNTLRKIGQYWCSGNYNRLLQIAENMPQDEYVIACRICDGRFFSVPPRNILRGKSSWHKRLETQWYMFVDPEFQEVY